MVPVYDEVDNWYSITNVTLNIRFPHKCILHIVMFRSGSQHHLATLDSMQSNDKGFSSTIFHSNMTFLTSALFLALLSSRHNLEISALHWLALSGLSGAALLSYFAPSTGGARRLDFSLRLLLYNALFGQLLSADVFFGKVSSIHSG